MTGGIVMRKQKEKMQELRGTIFELKAEGKTNREIGEMYGLTMKQVMQLANRERRKARKIAAGWIPGRPGRHRKTPMSEQESLEAENARLRMHLELMQNFLSEVERR